MQSPARAESQARWNAAHPDKAKEYQRRYRKKTANAASKSWRLRHPERAKAVQRKFEYGITQEQFDAMLVEQDHRCAICRVEFSNDVVPHVDHSHKAGRWVRGLLCRACNSGLGQFRDDPAVLDAALRYLAVRDAD